MNHKQKPRWATYSRSQLKLFSQRMEFIQWKKFAKRTRVNFYR